MSKIGIKPFSVAGLKVTVNSNVVQLVGAKKTIEHTVPEFLDVIVADDKLKLVLKDSDIRVSKKHKILWGLHRALLANYVTGLVTGFQAKINIVGLGYKGVLKGSSITFSLGKSHTINVDIAPDVSVEIDKSGQNLSLKSFDKFKLKSFCDEIRSLRPPEPYKGTGIFVDGEKIVRKAGKSKA